ncbi:MAG: hypothetical protein R6U92_04450 [Bacillota bacterium]
MLIEAKVHGHVVSLMPDGKNQYRISLEEPVTIRQFLRDHIGVNPLIFAAVVVDGKTRHLDFVLEDDSELILISPAAGG